MVIKKVEREPSFTLGQAQEQEQIKKIRIDNVIPQKKLDGDQAKLKLASDFIKQIISKPASQNNKNIEI